MQRKNVFSLQLNVCFTQTCNVWKFAMCKKCILSQLLKSIFCPRTLVKLRQGKIIKLQNRLLLPQCNITFCAINLFLLPFRSHCSTQNIGFSNSGYIIKPPQPSSTIYGALPFTGYPLKVDHSLKCSITMQPTKTTNCRLEKVDCIKLEEVSSKTQHTLIIHMSLSTKQHYRSSSLFPLFWNKLYNKVARL